MKKFLLLLVLTIAISSCSIDNNPGDSYTFEVLPVASFEVPETLKLGRTDTIRLTYQRPTSCHLFQGIYYTKDANIRTIAVQSALKDDTICSADVPAISETYFTFLPTASGSYIFKFYKGKDAAGENIFEDVEIQVTE
ncbi:hypothetical protein [Flavobacterium algicola]|uniref:hypothetical protein n=1 Tax=Flavobacterium algicola TaxID=556529 RepID=UPI001EFD94E4|nr:hypothetical protein [Flavobacterium algicola]MCG9791976.1 hypothetical protein [Flavobacterium algicola]